MVWTPPGAWAPGENAGVATRLNQELRDNLKMLSDPWLAGTTAWSAATTNPVLNNGVIDTGYMQVGKWIRFRIRITMGTTTTYGSGAYSLTLPVSEYAMRWSFYGILRDVSAGASWPLIAERESALVVKLGTPSTTAGNQLRAVTPTVPFAFGSTDEIILHGEYEAA